jgi:2-phospho-L-lactate guanylyltransferase
MNPVILVPVKDAAKAKSRMSPLLSADERAGVAYALLEDLIHALLPIPCPVVMATNSARAAARVRTLGWEVFLEKDQISESSSVDEASKRLAGNGFDAVLRLPADLPLVTTEDVAELLSRPLPSPSAIMVPSRDRMGTNALLRNPPDVFPSRFGQDSFAEHVREARAAGAQLRIVENPRIALDLDDPADIAHLLAQPAAGETYRVLLKFRVKERLLHYAG